LSTRSVRIVPVIDASPDLWCLTITVNFNSSDGIAYLLT